MEPALQQAGFKPKLAALFREMNVALNAGNVALDRARRGAAASARRGGARNRRLIGA